MPFVPPDTSDSTQQLNDVAEVLWQLTSDFTSVDQLDSLAAAVSRAIKTFVVSRYTALYLWDVTEQRLRLLRADGFTETERAAAERSAWERHPGDVFRSGVELHVADTRADGRTISSKRTFEVRSRLFMPVVLRGQVLGVFGLASLEPNAFRERHRVVLRFLTRLIGVVYGQILERDARERAQRDAASLAVRLKMLINSLPIGLIEVATGGTISLAQGAVLPLLASTDELSGQPVSVLFDAVPQVEDAVEAARGGRVTRFVVEVGARTLEFRCRPLDGGGVLLMVHDNTEQHQSMSELQRLNTMLARAYDEAVSATRAKSEFLTTMSHELRTPLNGIIGYGELVLEDLGEPAQTEEDVTRIVTAARGLLQLIDDILDLSRIESGQWTELVTTVEVEPVFRSVAAAVEPSRLKNGNTLTWESTPPDCHIDTDQMLFRRILMNLVGNANKFTRDGHIAVRAWMDGDIFRVTVTDTGIGIEAAQLARIFEPFTQADGSTSRRYGGTGLGLTITQQLLHQLGGDIEVSSTPGEGSCFRFWLPAAVVRESPEGES